MSRSLSAEMHVFNGNAGVVAHDYLHSTASLLVSDAVFFHLCSLFLNNIFVSSYGVVSMYAEISGLVLPVYFALSVSYFSASPVLLLGNVCFRGRALFLVLCMDLHVMR